MADRRKLGLSGNSVYMAQTTSNYAKIHTYMYQQNCMVLPSKGAYYILYSGCILLLMERERERERERENSQNLKFSKSFL